MHIHHLTLLVILSYNLDMVDKKNANVLSLFACSRISTSIFRISKDLIIIFMISLSNDNQWTVK